MKTAFSKFLIVSFLLVLGWPLLVADLPAGVGHAGSVGQEPESREDFPVIRVRVYDYAKTGGRLLERAEREADLLFEPASIRLEWSDCTSLAPACDQPLSRSDVVLRILPVFRDAKHHASRETMGAAIGVYASIYLPYVHECAERLDLSDFQVLAIAIAHELGHLLLADGQHSPRGIMRADWRPDDLRKAARRYLRFSADEATRMHANARSQANSQLAVRRDQ